MCGLGGLLDWSRQQDPAQAQHDLQKLSGDVWQRGPDVSVLVADEKISCVHARLSITGGVTGQQPIVSEDRLKFALFVGEIYNWRELSATLRRRHRFGTTSDGEVLLHGYEERGVSFLEEVDGMFALMIRDSEKNELVLARDRFGVKPLFWAMEAERVAFGTDSKSVNQLLGRPPQLSWRDALQTLGQPSGCSRVCWSGIEDIEPGTAVTFRRGQKPVVDRWNTFQYDPKKEDPKDTQDRYWHALEESVRRQTEDVKGLSIALSGGLDSSLLCALSKEKPTAFVLANSSTIANGELDAARKIARHLHLDLIEVSPRRVGQDTQEEYLDILRFFEHPSVAVEHVLKNELVRMVAGKGLRVLVSGQGSDEFNGGYSGFEHLPGQTPSLKSYLKQSIETEFYPQLLLENGIRPDIGRFIDWSHVGFLETPIYADQWEQELHRRLRTLQKHNLWLEDRLSGRLGIENRVPFLGQEVTKVAWSLPRTLQTELLTNKKILREVATGFLPASIVQRPKVPFFHGHCAGASFAYVTALLFFEGAGRESLVSMARQSKAVSGDGPLDRNEFDKLAILVERNHDDAGVEALMCLINLALLAEPGFLEDQNYYGAECRLCWLGREPYESPVHSKE